MRRIKRINNQTNMTRAVIRVAEQLPYCPVNICPNSRLEVMFCLADTSFGLAAAELRLAEATLCF